MITLDDIKTVCQELVTHLSCHDPCGGDLLFSQATCPNPYSGKYRDPASAGQQYADEVKRIIDDITSQEKKVECYCNCNNE